jgi:hypothetical protein
MLLLIRCPLPRTSARERSISSGGLPGPIARKENTVRLHRDDGLIIRLGLSLPGNSRMKVRPIGPVLGRVGAYAYDDLASRQSPNEFGCVSVEDNQAAHRRFQYTARAQIVASRKRMVPIGVDGRKDIPGFGRRAYSLHIE